MLPCIASHILTMIENFITLNHFEAIMGEWMPDLLKYKEKHTSFSEELELLEKSRDWIGLNNLTKDILSFTKEILDSKLMDEFPKLLVINDFKKEQDEDDILGRIKDFDMQKKISIEALKLRKKMETEF